MAMKGYSTFPKSLILEPHHQMQFSVIPSQSEPGSSGNEKVLPIPQITWTGASPSNAVLYPFKVDLGVVAMKRYSKFHKAPVLELHHQMQFSVIPSQSWPGSSGNEEVLHIPQISWIGASSSDGLVSHPGHCDFILCSDAVGVFFRPSRLGWLVKMISNCTLIKAATGETSR